MRQLLEVILPQSTHFDGFDIEHTFPTIGRRSMLLNARRVRFDTDRPPHILLAIEDITARAQAEQELAALRQREKEATFNSFFDTSAIGMAQIDPQGQFRRVNDRYCSMTGYSREELLNGMSPLDFSLTEEAGDKAAWVQQWMRADAPSYSLERHLRRKDGEVIWVHVNASPVRDESGAFQCSLKAIEDISDRKRNETLLLESERLLRLVIDTVPCFLFAKNRDGRFLFANHFTAVKSGFTTSEELVGFEEQNTSVAPHEAEQFLRADRQVIDSGQPLFIPAEPVTDCFGQTMIVQTTKVPFTFPGTNEPAVLGVSTDITAQLQLQKEVLEISDSEQRRIGQDLHDGIGQELTGLGFLAGELADSLAELSHASSNPPRERGRSLTDSPTSCPPTPDSPPPQPSALADAAGYYAIAQKLVEGLDRALKQVRQVSKGLVPVEVSDEGLQLALEELAANITAQTRVACRFTGSAEVHDSQTATNFYRIAQEATTNAIKHSQASLISLSLAEDDENITLNICDNGIGLLSQPASTSGLGLKIMRYRASLIGATLTIGLAQDGGTRITCILDKEISR